MLNRFGLTQSSEALVLVTASLSISVGPVYRRLRGRIDRFFSEEQANLMQTAEVLRSVVDDFRADLYSATASLYELLTLARAFPEGPYVGPRPEKVSKVRAGVPAALDEAFDRGFALDKAQRPASAEAFSSELTRAAGVAPASEAEVAAWVKGLLADVGELKPRSEEATRSVEVATAPG